MKKFIYFFIFFFVSIQYDVVAQKNDGTDYILNSQEFKTSFLEKSYYKDVKLPFNEIIIFDKRFDTSKLGYLKIPNIGKKAFGKIQLQRTWTAIINHYFRKNLNPSSTSKLIIYIRSFWMQEGALDEMTTKKVITKSILGKADAYGNSKADIDIYVQTDTTLQALFKIEDVFLNYYKFTANKMDEWFFLPFDSLARKMATTDVTLTLNKKRKLSFKEVNDFYSRRTNIPVLENTETQKGIYLTFEDFKNNKLWLTDFKFTNGPIKLGTLDAGKPYAGRVKMVVEHSLEDKSDTKSFSSMKLAGDWLRPLPLPQSARRPAVRRRTPRPVPACRAGRAGPSSRG